MIWRAIIFSFAIFTSLILAWSGFAWIWDGIGLNPWIAFPGAIIIHVLAYLWIAREAEIANTAIEDYLEYLDLQEQACKDLEKQTQYASYARVCGKLVVSQRQFWANQANRHL